MNKLLLLSPAALMIVSLHVTAQHVGIGTNTPAYPLTVIGTNLGGIVQKTVDVEIGFFTSPGTASVQTWSNHALGFATHNKAPAMILTTDDLVGIGTSTPSNKLHVESSTVSVSGAAIYGVNNGNSGNGILGVSNALNTSGVQGSSNSGTGIWGYSNSFRGVAGSTLTGSAIYGNSFAGYGLEIIGKVKISGGNTNPSSGAVLTSDALGNAVWKDNKIGFSATGSVNTAIPNNDKRKVEFSSESYDFNNNFVIYAGTVSTGSSVFTAPAAGVYHFSANVLLFMSSAIYNFSDGNIFLVKNGVVVAGVQGNPFNASASSYMSLQIDGDFHLVANDKIWIEVFQKNGAGTPQGFGNGLLYPGRFCGHLVFPD